MRPETLDDLATDVYYHVFEMLDEYFPNHEVTGLEADRIATRTEQAFRQALAEYFGTVIVCKNLPS